LIGHRQLRSESATRDIADACALSEERQAGVEWDSGPIAKLLSASDDIGELVSPLRLVLLECHAAGPLEIGG
jgi:hypothetical protein